MYVTSILPQADKELSYWLTRARRISCSELREQAIASIAHKRFHVLGGSVYALYLRSEALQYRSEVLRAIAAIQTISDYLDNLCDRAGVRDEKGFRQLHRAILDALEPAPFDVRQKPEDRANLSEPYYLYYPHSQDDGYLAELVEVCKANLASLPGYQSVQARALDLARLYCDLQSLKHLDRSVRQHRLQDWAQQEMGRAPGSHSQDLNSQLEWWEFAAATGSTLGLFLLFAIAAEGKTDDSGIGRTLDSYFPWICGLHILLDYLIDLEEDRIHDDFNFVACYKSEDCRRLRLKGFIQEAISRTRDLPRPGFHLMVIRGLLALYLSDPKVKATDLSEEARALCGSAGRLTSLMRWSCVELRRLGVF